MADGQQHRAEFFDVAEDTTAYFIHVFHGQPVGMFSFDLRFQEQSLSYHPVDQELYALFAESRDHAGVPSVLANLTTSTFRAKAMGAKERSTYYGREYTPILSRNGLVRVAPGFYTRALQDPNFIKSLVLPIDEIHAAPPSGAIIVQNPPEISAASLDASLPIQGPLVSGMKPKEPRFFVPSGVGEYGYFTPSQGEGDFTHIYKFANGEPARVLLEAAGLEASRAMGLDTTEYNLVKVVGEFGQSHFDIAIKRFDLPADKMVLMQDFYSLFGYDSENAALNSSLTYNALLKQWGDFLHQRLPADYPDREQKIQQEMRTMIDRVLLSTFLNDNDLHPKNMSAIVTIDPETKQIADISFSPTYDAVPAVPSAEHTNNPSAMFLCMASKVSSPDKVPGRPDVSALDKYEYRYDDSRPLRDSLREDPRFAGQQDPVTAYLKDRAQAVYQTVYDYLIGNPDPRVAKGMKDDKEMRQKVYYVVQGIRDRAIKFGARLDPLPLHVSAEASAYGRQLKAEQAAHELGRDHGMDQFRKGQIESVCN